MQRGRAPVGVVRTMHDRLGLRAMRWFAFGQEAVGVIAIGQMATGVIAIGQFATGVIAVGQLARGGIVVGQLSLGLASVGQLSGGVAWCTAMLGVGGFSAHGFLTPQLLHLRAPVAPARFPRFGVGRVLVFLALVAFWWFAAGLPLWGELAGPGGVFDPPRPLR